MKSKKINLLVKISVLSAMSIILYFFEFPLPIFPSFLKIDISDVPAILGAFSLGPVAGVIVELVKNLLHLLLKNDSAGIGELANFLVGAAFVLPAGILYKTKKSRTSAFIGLVAGIIFMSIVAAVGNYVLFLPLYEKILHYPINNMNKLIVFTYLPFNLLKGFILSVVVLLVYKRVSPILHR